MKLIKFLCMFWFKIFARVDDNIIFITSFYDKYSDSPKYISEAIYKIDSSKKIYWVIKNFDDIDVPSYVHKVKKDSLLAIKLQYISKIIIDNVYANKACTLDSNDFISKIVFRIRKWLCKKIGQKIYTTWHGTPLKKMGFDQVNCKMLDWHADNMTMILGNYYTYDIMNRLTLNKLNMKCLGIPRNDILFNNDISITELKKKLNLPVDKKVLLFAPSFRTDANSNSNNVERSGLNQLNSIDFDKLNSILKSKFDDEWVFVCRFHYHVEKAINWDEINNKYNGRVINGNLFDDMSLYLKCSDILVTDISSCVFDFALTYKPAFLYFPDLDYYSNMERGLYLDIKNLPFALSENVADFESSIINFNYEDYKKTLKQFNDRLNYVNLNDNSSNIIASYILEDSKHD